MEPRPVHSGGSFSAKAGAELAALIAARGTWVCARRGIMLGKPVAAGVWQTEKSGPTNGGDMSTAVAPAPARVTMFPASSVTRAAPPTAAAPAETSSRCDCVNLAMSYSKIGQRKKSAESEIQRVAPSRDPKETPERDFETFPAGLQENCNVCALRHSSVAKRAAVPRGLSGVCPRSAATIACRHARESCAVPRGD